LLLSSRKKVEKEVGDETELSHKGVSVIVIFVAKGLRELERVIGGYQGFGNL
jgi:hypothetical protein